MEEKIAGGIRITDGYQPHAKVYAIDIETATQGQRANDYTDRKKFKLGNVKDPAKVEAKLQEKREEARSKHALSAVTGKIISVALVDVYGDEEDTVICGHDETEILAALQDKLSKPCKLIGKSSKTFDFPFIVQRYMANAMQVPSVFKQKYMLYDVDEFFGWSSASSQRGTLDDYAWLIGYEAKPMDGAAVAPLYADIMASDAMKDHDTADRLWGELKAYNLHDAKVVAALTTLYYGTGRAGI